MVFFFCIGITILVCGSVVRMRARKVLVGQGLLRSVIFES